MKQTISILHLEDNPFDVELVQANLEQASLVCQVTCARGREEFELALRKECFDIILADYQLPSYDGISALRLAQELCPDIPFIFVSGTMGEDAAIAGLTLGATDYVLKQKLSRLVPAVRRALEDAENRRERRKAENALQESAERFRAVAESANEGIISIDSLGTVVYWNNAATAIFGYLQEEIMGQSVFLLMPEEDRERLTNSQLWEANSPFLQAGNLLESIGRRKDGRELPLEVSVGSWNTRAGTFFTVMVRDITERKRAEENLRLQSAALEAAANGIIITDWAGNITWANPAFTRLSGYSLEEIMGQNPRFLKSGKQDALFYQTLWETIRSGNVWHDELVNRRKDGRLYVEEMTIAPVRQPQGIISHFVSIKQDVSERKHHELEREAIISVADTIRSINTRTQLIPIFLHQIIELFDASGAMLSTYNVAKDKMIIEMGCGAIGERFSGLQLPPGEGVAQRVMAGAKPYLNNQADTDPLFFHKELLGDSHAAACVPLIAQGQVIGALWMVREKAIVESELGLLIAIANLAANAIHRVTLHEQTEQQLHKMAALHQIDTAINADFDLSHVLNVLLQNVITQLGVDAADVLLLSADHQALEYGAGAGFQTAKIQKSHVRLGEGRAGAAALERRIVPLPDLDQVQDTFSRITLLGDEQFVSHIVAPLIAKGQLKGVLEVFHRQRLNLTTEWFDFFTVLATQAAIAIGNANLFSDLQLLNRELIQAYQATIEGWAHAIDLRDKETVGHTRRVMGLCLHLAQAMSVEESVLVNMQRGAILHDIGKMGIPDEILFKPGPLTEEEWVEMRKHPIYAYEMLSAIHYLQPALDIPYCHHERWDGSGYPRGLQGEQIPLAARIFAVVDVWDALCTNRRYRPAWEESRVINYIRQQAGKHFDPDVVKAFLKFQPWRETKSSS